MKSSRIFTVGSLNIDLVTRMERLPREGETVCGGDLAVFPGGKGANQACAAALLGGHSTLIGETGHDSFGELILASLRSAGVDTQGVGVCEQATGSACISVLPSGENAIVISPGANAALSPAKALSRIADLERGDIVLLQLEVPLETVDAVLQYAAQRGAVTLLDPAPVRRLPASILRAVTYLTPNQSEAAHLLGDPHLSIDNGDTARRVAQKLMELGPRGVILKLGQDGCYVAADGFLSPVEGFAVEAIDTTAAGDTFNGALAVCLAEGLPISVAARFANAAAALSVTRNGAQDSIPNRHAVMTFLNEAAHEVMERNVCS
jgi:ribokinase